ncbi:ribonuclease PH [Limisalsivibrio acetivorans]|uniref:ribonuclease PH n=1 Tax=Limisalsivibrio acetivorans TaxID=1304888 RepID=UPI0003B58598|nr:ribonuclease PH [Limisalsivibrio acetivorans]
MRSESRANDMMRTVRAQKDYIIHPEGSVLMEFGNTKVICNASFTEGVPPFLRDTGQGWVTAEYSMLPRSTHTRSQREAQKGKLGGRTQEISRLIGRSLRAAVDMEKLGENTIVIDCDVIQADGGTRTASVTGGWIAMALAVEKMMKEGVLAENPLKGQAAAVSVGIVNGEVMLDLDYTEDSTADVDLNLVAMDDGSIIEIQGSSEKVTFGRDRLNDLLDYGYKGLEVLFEAQRKIAEL